MLDPARHTTPYLQAFLKDYGSAQRPWDPRTDSRPPSTWSKGRGKTQRSPSLTSFFRIAGRHSAAWNRCWEQYKDYFAGPPPHNTAQNHGHDFMVSFLDFVSCNGLVDFLSLLPTGRVRHIFLSEQILPRVNAPPTPWSGTNADESRGHN